MATIGALNGTAVLVQAYIGSGWVSIGGQVSHSNTLNNQLLETTNKVGSPRFRELLNDEAMQGMDSTIDMIFVSQSGYDFVRSKAGTKDQVRFRTISNGEVDSSFTSQIASFTDTSANGDALRGNVSLVSSGPAYLITPVIPFLFNGVDQSLTTPDNPDLAFSGTEQIWTMNGVKLNDWSPATEQTLISQWDLASNRSWRINFTANVLKFYLSNISNGFSSSSFPFSATQGASYDFRISRTVATGDMVLDWALSDQPYSNQELAGGFTGQLNDSASPVHISGFVNSLPDNNINGTFESFTIYDDARLALSWSADDYESGTTMESGGVTWTLNGGVGPAA